MKYLSSKNGENNIMKFGIIILNYFAFEKTIETCDSILSQNIGNNKVTICIVDNHSPNESYKILSEKYIDNSNIFVVKTDNNIGFARGNNFGYDFLSKLDTFDFIVCSNDDILIKNKNLFEWIIESYNKYNFGVLGPSIYSISTKSHQSPMVNLTNSIHKVNLKYIVNIMKIIIFKILNIFCKGKKVLNSNPINKLYSSLSDKYTLHGAFLVFSKFYLEKYKDIFDNRTFLYLEEDILRKRCEYGNIKMIYDPSFVVYHLQAYSTNLIVSNYYDKKIFRLKNINKSLKIYKNVLRGKL